LAKRRSRTRFVLISGAILAVLFVGYVASSMPAEPHLTDGAARLSTYETQSPFGASGPSRGTEHAYASDYRWVSPSELVRSDYLPLGKVLRTTIASTKGGTARSVFTPYPTISSYPIVTGPLSPDSKWLLYPHAQGYAAVNLESGKVATFKRTENIPARSGFNPRRIYFNPPEDAATLFAWLPDSRGFLEVSRDKNKLAHLQIRSLRDEVLKDVTIPPTGTARLPRPLGVTRDRRVVFVNQSGGSAGGFFTVNLDTNASAVKPLKVDQPPGTRLAWKTSTYNLSAGYRVGEWIGHLKDNRGPKYLNAIWVTDLDGSHPRRLSAELMSSSEEPAFRFVHWMPDGQHVSFILNDALYSVDAPK
jgi:hypothetical protein